MTASIRIQRGLPEALRDQAAGLYYEAFRQKLAPIFGDEAAAKRILAADFDGRYALVALDGERLVGIAGVQHDGGHLTALKWASFRGHFGLLAGSGRYLLLALLSRPQSPRELLMDGIVVDAVARGQGIGALLLDAVIAYARERGDQRVRLDVVDTNPDAQRLYARKGFVAVDSKQYGWLTRWLGFTGSTTMIFCIEQPI
jgi:GNAT superfamily N-acetyltransferase